MGIVASSCPRSASKSIFPDGTARVRKSRACHQRWSRTRDRHGERRETPVFQDKIGGRSATPNTSARAGAGCRVIVVCSFGSLFRGRALAERSGSRPHCMGLMTWETRMGHRDDSRRPGPRRTQVQNATRSRSSFSMTLTDVNSSAFLPGLMPTFFSAPKIQ
jgi:hypothetical protein